MAKRIMLDTNVVFAIHHNRTKAFTQLADYRDHTFLISSLVAVEVLVGAHPSQKADTKKFLSSFQVVPFEGSAVQESLRLAAKYFVDKSCKPTTC